MQNSSELKNTDTIRPETVLQVKGRAFKIGLYRCQIEKGINICIFNKIIIGLLNFVTMHVPTIRSAESLLNGENNQTQLANFSWHLNLAVN